MKAVRLHRALSTFFVCAGCSATPTPAPTPRPTTSATPAMPSASAVSRPTPSASASTDPRALSLPPLDDSTLTEPPTEWTFRTNGAEPVRVARGVLVVDEREVSVSLVDEKTGGRVFRVTPPSGTFDALHASRDGALVLVSGSSGTRSTLTRLDPARGTILWHATDAGGDPSFGHDGTGISESARGTCSTQLRDAKTGQRIARRFDDSRVHMHGHGDEPGGTMCRRATWIQLARGDVSLVAHRAGGRESALSGISTGGATRYEIPIGDAHPRLVHADDERATLLLLGHDVVALRIVVATGKVLWRRAIADEAECGADRGPFQAETTVDASGRARAAFVRACGAAQLVDLASGATGWKRSIGADAAFLTGSKTHPWEEDRIDPVPSSEGVRAFSEDGREVARVALPSNAGEAGPFAGGVLVTSSGLDGAALLEPSGQARWRIGVSYGNAFVRDDAFVLLRSGSNTHVVVDGASGRRFVVRGAAPWVIGKVGALWITARDKPHALVALRP